jgi:hypothetical protein
MPSGQLVDACGIEDVVDAIDARGVQNVCRIDASRIQESDYRLKPNVSLQRKGVKMSAEMFHGMPPADR